MNHIHYSDLLNGHSCFSCKLDQIKEMLTKTNFDIYLNVNHCTVMVRFSFLPTEGLFFFFSEKGNVVVCACVVPAWYVSSTFQNFSELSRVFRYSLPKQALVCTCLLYKLLENTVGKGEIARNEQFRLFAQCFLPVWRTFCHFHQI